MKYISFTVPCYNSQEYMRKCVDSLLVGGEDVEIIIVNDGSSDGTLAIANEYATQYPTIVRVVDKENGGHGSGVNAGMALAQGLYFKVVDSDDWVDAEALNTLLDRIKQTYAAGNTPDLFVINFVYEHVADNTRYVSRYTKYFPVEEQFGWKKVGRFYSSHMLLMHALVYRTDILRKSGLKLPEHTFYVDDIFSYSPLPHVKTIRYLDIDFYRYFIGRADQSVNLVNMVRRYEQMIRVITQITDAWTLREIKSQPRGLKRYMLHSMFAYMLTTHLFICAEDSPERRTAYREMWAHIKEKDAALYRKLRYRTPLALVTIVPWKLRGKALVRGYRFFCKKVKLG